jgi:hypothetical protein
MEETIMVATIQRKANKMQTAFTLAPDTIRRIDAARKMLSRSSFIDQIIYELYGDLPIDDCSQGIVESKQMEVNNNDTNTSI